MPTGLAAVLALLSCATRYQCLTHVCSTPGKVIYAQETICITFSSDRGLRRLAGTDIADARSPAAGRRRDQLSDDGWNRDHTGQWGVRLGTTHPRHQGQLPQRNLEAHRQPA